MGKDAQLTQPEIFIWLRNPAMLSFPPMSDPSSPDRPQFSTAEYAGTPGEDRCRFCKQPIAQTYYRVNGHMACGSCADVAQREMPKDTHSAFGRALVFGIGAAFLGMAMYAGLVMLLQGWTIGYFSLAVGYIVGKAMMFGSKGFGGRRYQIAAVLLTYAAVSTAAIPIGIAQIAKQKHEKTQQEQLQDEQRQFEQESGQATTEPQAPKTGLGAALAYLALMGLASPFLEIMDNPAWGAIGLLILFVGMRIAWRMTQGKPNLEVSGPFDAARPKPA
jgi:hypothetical protein